MAGYMNPEVAKNYETTRWNIDVPQTREGHQTIAVLDKGPYKIAVKVTGNQIEYKSWYDAYNNGHFINMDVHYVPNEVFDANRQ